MLGFVWLVLASSLASTATAIFEEQAGQVDWHKQNLGRVLHAQFAFRGRERVFVGTASAAVASIDTRDGSIAWRQVLEETDQVEALVLVPRPASVLTLSRQGRILRAWHALDGTLLWEKSVADTSSEQRPAILVLPDVTGDGSSEVAVVSGSKLQVRSAPSGKLVWSTTLSGSAEAAAQGLLGEEPIIAVAVAESSGIFLRTFDARSGEQLSSKQLSAHASQVTASSRAAAALTADGELCVAHFDAAKSVCEKLSSLLKEGSKSVNLGDFLDASTLALYTDDGLNFIGIEGKLSIKASYPGYTAAAASEAGLIGLVGTRKSQLHTALVSLEQQKIVSEAQFDAQPDPSEGKTPNVLKVLVGSRRAGEYSKPEKTLHRWLLVSEDDSLVFIEGGRVVWRREEGLANIRASLFIDLPASPADANAQSEEKRVTLMDRVNAEILTVKSTFGIIQPRERQQLKDLNQRISTHLLPHRDSNGFRKLVVALSASGKLFALHSGDGRILWQIPLRGAGENARLFLWRSSHDTHQAPEVLVLSSKDGAASYTLVNAHNGSALGGGSIAGSLQQVIGLPGSVKDGSYEQNVFALVSDDAAVTTLPESIAARELLSQQPLHFWTHKKATGTISGYRLAPGLAVADLQWSLAFSGPSDTVLRIAARDPNEHVYSYAKVLGNRSLKLKYLNPNAIFVITGPPNGAPTSAIADPILTVHLIDTVSGQIIYRQSLQGAKGPVSAVVSENWAVYSYYSTANTRHELAVLEFYDAQSRSLSIPSLLFGTQNSSLSAYAPTPIEVLHQSYFTAIGVKTMAVTMTRRGISSKQLLLGTNTNQVYLLDKRFADPRRPKGTPTAEEKAEMLPPYHEELLFAPQQFASHKEVIEGLKGIIASPANLESTTLTLAYGLDLFFTRVQPSKTFDLLPDDFPYALLILVTGTLTVAAFILKRLDTASSLKRKWL